ncbi:uncharacterized protein LOC128167624 isoform X1 [Crassostrea angulata]|uniref:uncharacterized protein LOC128167624 isoform X1 n=1 Tax=Magallana angulata TaxID=2784310 RepID=UPI0022B0A606|nr:uncharacterized protein LOC128167624 isoform X1 [Crassostrea angulata]
MTSSFFLKSANLPLCAITRVTRDTVISHSLMACSLMNGRVLCKDLTTTMKPGLLEITSEKHFTLGRDSSRTYNNLSTTDVTEQHVDRSTLINESYAFNSTPIPHETTSSENESLALFPITSPNDFTATMHDSTPLTQSVKQTTPLIKHSTNISSVMTTNASLPSAATSSSHYFTVTSNLTDLTTADTQTRITTIGTKNTESLVNEAFSIAITAIIMAGLIGLGILLRYLLRRYRNYILRRGRRDSITAAPREDISYRRTLAAAQEVEAAATLATIKKEPVTPHSCHCTLAAAQELRHAIKQEPASPRSCRRTLSMPVISPRKDPYLRDELIAL